MKGGTLATRVGILVTTTLDRVVWGFAAAPFSPSLTKRTRLYLSSSSKNDVGSPVPLPSSPTLPSWDELQTATRSTVVGKAMNEEVQLRESSGEGSSARENKLRTFGKSNEPKIILHRDPFAWCPVCQQTMLLVEEKRVPVQINLVNLRKEDDDQVRAFLNRHPSGQLPALEVSDGRIITEPLAILESIDQCHGPSEGYQSMMPTTTKNQKTFQQLVELDRDWFHCWRTVVFHCDQEEESSSLVVGDDSRAGADENVVSRSACTMKDFFAYARRVDDFLTASDGPWFFDEFDHPTIIDFVFVSHVELMLASMAFWKGLDLRDPQWNLPGLQQWIDAFEKRETYLGFKVDYSTQVMALRRQYGEGREEKDGDVLDHATKREKFQQSLLGQDGSWHLPLAFDDVLQPLYRGVPLPLCVLKACAIAPETDGSYTTSDPVVMAQACRSMAAWKLALNGDRVAGFAARGGAKKVGASVEDIQPSVDVALRVVCQAMVGHDETSDLPQPEFAQFLQASVPVAHQPGVIASLGYVRNSVGVPRDLPLAAARYLRAYLNWGVDVLSSSSSSSQT